MSKDFTVTMSPFFKVTTTLLIIFLVLVGISMTYYEKSIIPNTIYWGTILIVILYCYLFSLNKIKVDLNNIYLISKIRTVIIPIKEIDQITKKSQNNLIIIGARGIYGLIGISMDNYRCNIKDRSKLIAIELNSIKYLISCDNPQELINTINELKHDEKKY